MTSKNKFELEENFKFECKVIDLRYEYTGYRENIRWAIATSLTEALLKEKYGEIVARYEPYLLLSEEHAKIFVQFHSNERKHKMRNAEHGDAFGYEDGEMEKYHPELIEILSIVFLKIDSISKNCIRHWTSWNLLDVKELSSTT